jgi:hypothetical protein
VLRRTHPQNVRSHAMIARLKAALARLSDVLDCAFIAPLPRLA